MKKSLPWIISACLLTALVISISWTNKHTSIAKKEPKETFCQFVTWTPSLPDPWWSKDQCLNEYVKNEGGTAKDLLIYNCTVYSSSNKLLAYKKPDSAWVIVDAPGAVDYLASLLYREHQKKDAPAVVDSLMKLLYEERQKSK